MSQSPLDGDLRRTQLRDQSRGRKVPASPKSTWGALQRLIDGGDADARPRGLGHTDHGQTIGRRLELCGSPETIQVISSSGGSINPERGNSALVQGGTVSITTPPPVPADQVPDGAPTRTRAWGITVFATAATTLSGVDWGEAGEPEHSGGLDVWVIIYVEGSGIGWIGLEVARGFGTGS